jgi:hypothetical protein
MIRVLYYSKHTVVDTVTLNNRLPASIIFILRDGEDGQLAQESADHAELHESSLVNVEFPRIPPLAPLLHRHSALQGKTLFNHLMSQVKQGIILINQWLRYRTFKLQ